MTARDWCDVIRQTPFEDLVEVLDAYADWVEEVCSDGSGDAVRELRHLAIHVRRVMDTQVNLDGVEFRRAPAEKGGHAFRCCWSAGVYGPDVWWHVHPACAVVAQGAHYEGTDAPTTPAAVWMARALGMTCVALYGTDPEGEITARFRPDGATA